MWILKLDLLSLKSTGVVEFLAMCTTVCNNPNDQHKFNELKNTNISIETNKANNKNSKTIHKRCVWMVCLVLLFFFYFVLNFSISVNVFIFRACIVCILDLATNKLNTSIYNNSVLVLYLVNFTWSEIRSEFLAQQSIQRNKTAFIWCCVLFNIQWFSRCLNVFVHTQLNLFSPVSTVSLCWYMQINAICTDAMLIS